MGCCQSTDREPWDPPPARPRSPGSLGSDPDAARPYNSSSQAAINQPSRSLSNIDSQAPSSIPPSQHSRPNQPIRPPTPLQRSPANVSSTQPPWTRSHLEREREAFFETRTSGNEEVWSAMRVICELLRKEETAEAQAILDAVNLSCPNGRVAQGRGRNREKGGIYDERGGLYEVPAWVLTDPADIIEDDDEEKEDVSAVTNDGEDEEEDPQITTPHLEKGKGRAPDLGEIVRVRARLSDRATDVVVEIGMKQRIDVLVMGIQSQIGPRQIRLVYLGKTWSLSKMLEETNWKPGHVVNALVYEGDEQALRSKIIK